MVFYQINLQEQYVTVNHIIEVEILCCIMYSVGFLHYVINDLTLDARMRKSCNCACMYVPRLLLLNELGVHYGQLISLYISKFLYQFKVQIMLYKLQHQYRRNNNAEERKRDW